MNTLAPISKGINFNKNGLVITKNLSMDEWMALGDTLDTMQGSIQWWIGDWINYGEKKYGETYSQAIDSSKYSYQALANMKYVASRIEPSLRKENIAWSHHMVVAPLEKKEQQKYLLMAEEENLSVSSLKKIVNVKKECDCTIKDMRKMVIHEYECKHGKVIRHLPNAKLED